MSIYVNIYMLLLYNDNAVMSLELGRLMLSLLCLTTFCSKTTTVQAYLLLLRSDQLRLHDVSMYKATASTRVGVPSVELHRVPSVPGFKNHRHQRFQDPVEISAHRPLLWILAQAFPYPGIRSFQETQ
ncbi:hypothetical protein V6N13_076576 [Hibiscus sabdariffa]